MPILRASPLAVYRRGVSLPYDAPSFGLSSPPRIIASFPASPYTEKFDDLQLQPDGGLLLLGRSTKYSTSSTLTKRHADGTVDVSFAAGTGRLTLPVNASGLVDRRLLKSSDGTAT